MKLAPEVLQAPFSGGEDEGYFDNPTVAGSTPAMASCRVAQWIEHRKITVVAMFPGENNKARNRCLYG